MYRFNINERKLFIISLIYLSLPIYIFYFGYLKIWIAILLCSAITLSMFYAVKRTSKSETFSVSLLEILIISVVSAAWVWSSGVGGFWFQMPDWLWRTALFRDLIGLTWPIEYPNKNYLTYYFGFFLPSALIGKISNWNIANFSLAMFTWIGLILTFLYIALYLRIEKTRQYIILIGVFIIYGGVEEIRSPIANLTGITATIGYQFSPNETLLKWVTNQTIYPWLAVAIFLYKREIYLYAYLGMCILAVAPLPFCGFVLICLLDFLFKFIVSLRNNKNIFTDVFSLSNIIICLAVLPVYYLFYTENPAANGNYQTGGVGFYLPPDAPFNIKWIANYLTFLLFNAGIFLLVIYKAYKKNNLYYIIIFSLFVLPLFRVGTGWDFQMRATIPALFILCVFLIGYIVNYSHRALDFCFLLCIFLLSVKAFAFYNEKISQYVWSDNFKHTVQDGIFTFSGKLAENASYSGGELMNFLSEPHKSFFFDVLCKKKQQSALLADNKWSKETLSSLGFPIESFKGKVKPYTNQNLYLTENQNRLSVSSSVREIVVSTSTCHGFYELYSLKTLDNIFNVLTFDTTNNMLQFIRAPGLQSWGQANIPSQQLFRLVKSSLSDCFYILSYNGKAVTLKNNEVILSEFQSLPNQQWLILH